MRNIIATLACMVISSYASCKIADGPGSWRPADTVSASQVERFGADRCFFVREIDDDVFARIYGKSYKRECTVPLSDLRYIRALHYDAAGRILVGEMVCNKAVSDDVVAILRALFEARYPIERMVLIDEYDADDERSMAANNSSSFNFRYISGTNRLSNHSDGMAVDINPLYNPYVRVRGGVTTVDPEAGRPYSDRSRSFVYKIERDDVCYREFVKRGFVWGGDWTSLKDYQHFEKRR